LSDFVHPVHYLIHSVAAGDFVSRIEENNWTTQRQLRPPISFDEHPQTDVSLLSGIEDELELAINPMSLTDPAEGSEC